MSQQYDYIIIGSGIAGLYTALLAQEYGSVLILTKGSIEDCNTRYAQGGIAAAIGEDDSPELHMKDTIAAGAGLCDPEAVRILAEEASDRIADLIRMGVVFDTVNAEIALAREGAHTVRRVLHAGGDATGARIELTLAGLARSSRVTIHEFTLATRIIVDEGVAKGVEVLHAKDKTLEEIRGRWIVLATGGAGSLFKYTTNPDVATGDGVALAFQAGAAVMDMEFFQFHPTALHLPGAQPFLISEAVRGEGGFLRNSEGDRFMKRYNPQEELAPRDIVSRAMLEEMKKTRADHVLLDVTHLQPSKIASRFPTIYRFCLDHGLDMAHDPIPVAPAAHYMMGGVKTNTWAETTIPGLYACGECAALAVHGANRLASNSLMETIVFGKRLVEHTQGRRGNHEGGLKEMVVPSHRRELVCADVPALSLQALQTLMWEDVGVLRHGARLLWAIGILDGWNRAISRPKERAGQELVNMVTVGRLMAEAALIRKESRGAHFRLDYPAASPEWEKHIVLVRGE